MNNQFLFKFKTDISCIDIPSKLNNPFYINLSKIAEIAAKEFQEFINFESKKWDYDFSLQRGKMFGVLVIRNQNNAYFFLGTVSGKLPKGIVCKKFIPSVFSESTDSFFINKGMVKLSELGNKIKQSNSPSEIIFLKEKRKQKSISLQKKLFKNYRFENLSGKQKNILEIFNESGHGNPPVASGECAAPKLLQYAIKNQLKPIALKEFWWGTSPENKNRKHKSYYPACKNRCRPILEYILENRELFAKEGAEI